MPAKVKTAPFATASPAPIPRLGGGMPVLGHGAALRRNPIGLLMRGWHEHGELFDLSVLGRTFTVFLGPEAHEAYFRAPDSVLSQKEVYQFTVPIFGRGVAYDAAPELMAEQVAFLYPAVREGRLQTYANHMFDETVAYIDDWGEEGEIDLLDTMNSLTVNIACRCLLGPEIRDQLYGGFDRLYHDLQRGINLIGFFSPHLLTPGHLRRDRARRKVGELIGGILAERRRHGREAEDFMQTLMSARYSDGRELSSEEITGILITSLFAGQHTSKVLSVWAGLELFQHDEYLPDIRQEIATVHEPGKPPSFDVLRRQTRLEYAIREAERLHPPLIILVRQVVEDFDYKGHRIRRGNLALVSPAAAHRLPQVFPQPDTYNPDRFRDADGGDKLDPYTMITFGGGKHVCIGMHFAYMQIKVIWSVLLSRFDFSLISPAPEPDYGAWVTGPKPPVRVRYRRRPPSEIFL